MFFNMIYQPSMIEKVFCSSYGDIPFEVDQVSQPPKLSPHFGPLGFEPPPTIRLQK